MYEDPEINRYYRKYPSFPGVKILVDLLRRRNVQGVWIDIIVVELAMRAAETHDELIAAYRAESNPWVKTMLLMALAKAGLPEALPIFVEILRSNEVDHRTYAIEGLEKIGTKEARRLLYEYARDN